MEQRKSYSHDVVFSHFWDEGKPELFSSLQELLTFIGNYDTSGCFFRGQAGLWPIVSTMYRHRGTELFERARLTAGAAVAFLKNNQYIRNAVQDNTNRALAIAQHYGCPTDLVDVTTSLEVAAYFASSEDQDHAINPRGCIWIFTQDDIEMLRECIYRRREKMFVGASETILKELQDNDWNLLYQINIPELSRLNAQCGAFLWDVGGSLDKLLEYVVPVGIRLEFEHTPNERELFRELETRLLPFPNQLESEIMRVFNESSRSNGLPTYNGLIQKVINENTGVTKDGLHTEIVDAFGTDPIVIPPPDFFQSRYAPYPWIKRQITEVKYKAKKMDMSQCVHCYIQYDVEVVQMLVENILDAYRAECLTDYLIVLLRGKEDGMLVVEDVQPIIEMVISLSNYEYTSGEIARVLLEYFRLELFKAQNGYSMVTDEDRVISSMMGMTQTALKKYYGCNVTKLYLDDNQEGIPFWLPENYCFLEPAYQEDFAQFDRDVRPRVDLFEETFAEIPDNAQIFLYQHKPAYIMPYDRLKEIFTLFYLPQLYAFRMGSERIMIPDYVTGILLPYFGRELYISKQ